MAGNPPPRNPNIKRVREDYDYAETPAPAPAGR